MLVFTPHSGYDVLKEGHAGVHKNMDSISLPEDLAQLDTVIDLGSRPLSVVTDGNDGTCLGASPRQMSLKWAIPYHITWVRLHLHESCKFLAMTCRCLVLHHCIINVVSSNIYSSLSF